MKFLIQKNKCPIFQDATVIYYLCDVEETYLLGK